MKSLPLIQASVSKTQQQFADFVERHVNSLYEADSGGSLPGDTVRTKVKSAPVAADVAKLTHIVEFMALGLDGHWQAVGCIGHAIKETETMQGTRIQLESTFEIRGPGIPHGRFRHGEVEPVVQHQLDKLAASRLLPLSSRSDVAVKDLAPEGCAP
jgi:hypothetical protein